MEWLHDIIERILSILPRIVILAPNESGVRITFGKYVSKKNAGWYFWWPIVQRFIYVEITPQIVDLRNQSVRTKDRKNIVVSGAIQYSISNAQKAILHIQDFDKSLEALALGIILEFASKRTLEECENIKELKEEILKGIKDAAGDWGLKIQKIYITDLGETKNFRLLTNKTKEIIEEI